MHQRHNRLRRRVSRALLAFLVVAFTLALPTVALAYDDYYGGYTIGGNGGYIQTSGAHTFEWNAGSSIGTVTYLACQLFNHSGSNVVSHGYGSCAVHYTGRAYVWGRVYNQSAFSDTVYGHAYT